MDRIGRAVAIGVAFAFVATVAFSWLFVLATVLLTTGVVTSNTAAFGLGIVITAIAVSIGYLTNLCWQWWPDRWSV